MTVKEALSLRKGDYVFYRMLSSIPVVQAMRIDVNPKLSPDGKRVEFFDTMAGWPSFNELSSITIRDLELSYEMPTLSTFAEYVAMSDYERRRHPERYIGEEKDWCDKYRGILDCIVRHIK
jgi:hypothetical protein